MFVVQKKPSLKKRKKIPKVCVHSSIFQRKFMLYSTFCFIYRLFHQSQTLVGQPVNPTYHCITISAQIHVLLNYFFYYCYTYNLSEKNQCKQIQILIILLYLQFSYYMPTEKKMQPLLIRFFLDLEFQADQFKKLNFLHIFKLNL